MQFWQSNKNQMCSCKNGFGMVEILISVAFFTLALMPLISLFTSNADTLKVIQARSEATLLALELSSQAVLCKYEDLTQGMYNLGNDNSNVRPEFAKKWKLSTIPGNFVRTLIITEEKKDEQMQKVIQIGIHNTKISQANLTWFRTILLQLSIIKFWS